MAAISSSISSSIAASQCLAVLPQLPGVAAAASAFVATFRPQVLNIAQAVASLGNLQAWLDTPLVRFQELGLRSFRAAVAFGQRVYFAALAARDAVVRGDPDGVAERFLVEWLELPRSRWKERLEAGKDALLWAPIEDFGPEPATELLEWIKMRCNSHFRRGTRSLEETELNHRPVQSIEQLPAGEDTLYSWSKGSSPMSRPVEDRVLFVLNQIQDDRLEAIMGGMGPADALVVWAKMLGNESGQSAAAAGRRDHRIRLHAAS